MNERKTLNQQHPDCQKYKLLFEHAVTVFVSNCAEAEDRYHRNGDWHALCEKTEDYRRELIKQIKELQKQYAYLFTEKIGEEKR